MYYTNTCFAVVLHPQFKTEYFEDENWKKTWIDAAKEIISDQWDTHYKDAAAREEPDAAVSIISFTCISTDD